MMVAAGESAEAIAEQVGCHLRTAQRYNERYQTTGEVFTKPMTPYNPTKLTPYIMETSLWPSPAPPSTLSPVTHLLCACVGTTQPPPR